MEFAVLGPLRRIDPAQVAHLYIHSSIEGIRRQERCIELHMSHMDMPGIVITFKHYWFQNSLSLALDGTFKISLMRLLAGTRHRSNVA